MWVPCRYLTHRITVVYFSLGCAFIPVNCSTLLSHWIPRASEPEGRVCLLRGFVKWCLHGLPWASWTMCFLKRTSELLRCQHPSVAVRINEDIPGGVRRRHQRRAEHPLSTTLPPPRIPARSACLTPAAGHFSRKAGQLTS